MCKCLFSNIQTMKIVTILLSFFFCVAVLDAQKKPLQNQLSGRSEKKINSQWAFSYFPDEDADKGYEAPGFDDSKWPAVSLPHTWNTYEVTGDIHSLILNREEYGGTAWRTGWGWYRKHFSVSRDLAGKRVFAEINGVQKQCKVWFNGTYLGDNKEWHGSFDFDLTRLVKQGGDNVLAIAVNNRKSGNGYTREGISGTPEEFGGIHGYVALVLKNNLHIPMQGSPFHDGGTVITAAMVSEKEGIVKVQTWVKNSGDQMKKCTLQTTITDSSKNTAQVMRSDAQIGPDQLFMFEQTGKPVRNPHIWKVSDPYMHKVTSEVFEGSELADVYSNQAGLRFTGVADTLRTLSVSPLPFTFDEIFLSNMKKDSADTRNLAVTGAPSKVILTASVSKIDADRAAVVIVTADFADNSGNRVSDCGRTIRWKVTGPACLAGPSFFVADSGRYLQPDAILYRNLPVVNLVRSTGKPGKIMVTAYVTGLASGTADIIAEAVSADNSIISEPVLADEGRKPLARFSSAAGVREEVPSEISHTVEGFSLDSSEKSQYEKVIKEFILKNNTVTDSSSVEFGTLTDLLATHLAGNNGKLSADDYNYNADNYNKCRLISGYIMATKLPPLFREGLKKYYAEEIIYKGNDRNAGEEMNWLNWIPSGGTVVFVTEGTTAQALKDAVYTKNSRLDQIITAVYPQFAKFSPEARERALIFISKMNPYIRVTSDNGKQEKKSSDGSGVGISYLAEPGRPVLIPLVKFISE
jgi:hypothetical protein